MGYILEICVDSVESAIEAVKGGANRIELCSNLIIGGTTPSIILFNLIRKNVDVKINVLIRPRFGDFCYTENEYEIIKDEIQMFKEAGADGVVIGILKPDGTIDSERMKELIKLSEGMHVTLHRAFDVARDPYEALEEAKELGINSILTSGQKNTCYEGKELLKLLVEKSKDKIEILIGSGLNSNNIEEIMNYTKSVYFHLSGKIELESNMHYRNKDVNMGLPILSEYTIFRTDYRKIKKVKDILEKYLDHKEQGVCM